MRDRFIVIMNVSMILACSCFKVHGQSPILNYASFTIDSKEVVWTKVFETPGTTANELGTRLDLRLNQNKFIHNITTGENGMSASIKNATIDFKKFNVRFMNISYRISYGKWSGQVQVDVEDGQYRVTVSKLSYYAKSSGPKWGHVQRPPFDERGTLSKACLDKSKEKFVKSKLKDLDVIHVTLLDYFLLSPDLELESPIIVTIN